MARARFAVRGLRELQQAARRADRESRTEVRKALGEVGEVLLREWQTLLRPIDQRTAAGLRVRVTTKEVSVRQSERKTTGRRPDFGALQMRRGSAALDTKQREIEKAAEGAVDRIADHFERGP